MKVLIADKLSQRPNRAQELGPTLEVKADLTADDLPAAIGDARCWSCVDEGDGGHDRRRQEVVADRACRSRRQHDRRGGCQPTRDLRHELSRPEQRGGGRTGHRVAHRLRSPDRQCHERSARRPMAKEGIWQGEACEAARSASSASV